MVIAAPLVALLERPGSLAKKEISGPYAPKKMDPVVSVASHRKSGLLFLKLLVTLQGFIG